MTSLFYNSNSRMAGASACPQEIAIKTIEAKKNPLTLRLRA